MIARSRAVLPSSPRSTITTRRGRRPFSPASRSIAIRLSAESAELHAVQHGLYRLHSATSCTIRSSAWASPILSTALDRRGQRCLEDPVHRPRISRNQRSQFAEWHHHQQDPPQLLLQHHRQPDFAEERHQRISRRRNCRPGRHRAVDAPDCSVQALQARCRRVATRSDSTCRVLSWPDTAEWWRRLSSASIWAAKMTCAALIFVPSLRSRFFRTRAQSSCAIRTAPWSPRTPAIRCGAATPFPFRWSGSCFLAAMPAWSRIWNTGSPSPGPVALAPFVDLGMNPIVRGSQLRINPGQLADINSTVFGCPALDIALNCSGGHLQNPPVFPEFADCAVHELDSPYVHRTGAAGIPAGGQRSVPGLLGLQPAAIG